MILSISEAIEEHTIINNEIYVTSRIELIFSNNWCKFLPSSCRPLANIYDTIVRTSSTELFSLVPVLSNTSISLSQTWNRSTFANAFKYGILDDELYDILKDKKFRDSFRKAIQDNVWYLVKLSPSKVSALTKSNLFQSQIDLFLSYIQGSKISSSKYFSYPQAVLLASEFNCRYVQDNIKDVFRDMSCNLTKIDTLSILYQSIHIFNEKHNNGLGSLYTIKALELYMKMIKNTTKKELKSKNIITIICNCVNVVNFNILSASKHVEHEYTPSSNLNYQRNSHSYKVQQIKYEMEDKSPSSDGFKDFLKKQGMSESTIKMRLSALDMSFVKKILLECANMKSIYGVRNINVLNRIKDRLNDSSNYYRDFIGLAIQLYIAYYKSI